MVVDRTPERENAASDLDSDPDVEAMIEGGDDELESDDARHYLQDPDHLAGNARDADEREQDEILDLDQTELEELGLTLDDPHQPNSE